MRLFLVIMMSSFIYGKQYASLPLVSLLERRNPPTEFLHYVFYDRRLMVPIISG